MLELKRGLFRLKQIANYKKQYFTMEKMRVFLHQIYEYRKGVRSMALCTLPEECLELAKKKMETNEIYYLICPIGNDRYNIFFGEKVCIDVVTRFCNKPLNRFSPEEDFILGTMLGYSISEQCKRYCRKNRETFTPTFA